MPGVSGTLRGTTNNIDFRTSILYVGDKENWQKHVVGSNTEPAKGSVVIAGTSCAGTRAQEQLKYRLR